MTKPIASTSRTTSLLSGTLLAGAALFASFAPGAAAATPPPPELAPLLQKTGELLISSERFSSVVTIGGKKLPAKLKALGDLRVKISGEQTSSPEAVAITETALGKTLMLRLVDNAIYIRDASLTEHDGGRPWVKEQQQSSSGVFGSSPSLGSGSSGSGQGSQGSSAGGAASGHFASEIALLKESKDVRSLGASTADGQPVTGFAGTLDPQKVEDSSLPAKLRAQLRKLHIKPTAQFAIYLAANGLPVHTQLVLGLGGVSVDATEDVLAINFPVAAIAPPPAAETISASELKKLLEKLKKGKKKT